MTTDFRRRRRIPGPPAGQLLEARLTHTDPAGAGWLTFGLTPNSGIVINDVEYPIPATTTKGRAGSPLAALRLLEVLDGLGYEPYPCLKNAVVGNRIRIVPTAVTVVLSARQLALVRDIVDRAADPGTAAQLPPQLRPS